MSDTTIDAATPVAIDENGYRLAAGYRVKDYNLNGRPGIEIIVSPSKRIVIQALKMSEQFDLFEILSSSENAVYRNMATMAASVRALGVQPIPQPVAPRFFPKSGTELRALLDDLDDDGVMAILGVQGAERPAATQSPEAIAKN